jgi:hypothetical protein
MALKEKWETLSQYLDASLIKGVRDALKFDCIMPVQKAVIPHFCTYKDVIVEVLIPNLFQMTPHVIPYFYVSYSKGCNWLWEDLGLHSSLSANAFKK